MREFTELSTKEVLALAIVIEERNRDLYTEWAARFRSYDLPASVLLEELAKEEEDHRTYLIKRYIEQFGSSVIRINREWFSYWSRCHTDSLAKWS